VRGPNDYDAFVTDKDLWQFNLTASAAQSWALSWDLQKGDAGVPPGELALEVTTCSGPGPGDGGLCEGARTFLFGYSARALSPWYLPNNASTARQLFSRVDAAGVVTVSTLPGVGCECLSTAHAAAGRFFVNVAAVNRLGNEPLAYTLRQSVAPYPTPASCPVVDAGCGFGVAP
jgi:hypothetical protein